MPATSHYYYRFATTSSITTEQLIFFTTIHPTFMSKHMNATGKLPLSERFANNTAKMMGSTAAFIAALLIVVVWAICGPIFHYSNNWQLVINTGTTIITFLMVFLIQKAQNKDSLAIQLKLNELVAAHEFASNRLVDIENIPEDELKIIQKYYTKLGLLTKQDESLQQSHSIDEAEKMDDLKEDREDTIMKDLGKNE